MLGENNINKIPITQGIKYIGSKLKLLPFILHTIKELNAHSVFDGFSGTTRVSQALAKSGYKVICNDIAVWSEIFGTCYLLNNKQPQEYKDLIDHLNNIKPHSGWFTENYSNLPKKPWQIHNIKKLDGIREEIENLKLDNIEKAVCITSLILALDKVDNTIGHFVSYLKNWSSRSYNNLELKIPEIQIQSQQHKVFRGDIFDIIPSVSADVAYFDPPYGSNNDKMPSSRVRYASYYHLWTSVCLFDKPKLFGKSNRRIDTSDKISTSIFEEFRRNKNGNFIVIDKIEELIKKVDARWIILSYNSGGRATLNELNDVLRDNGQLIKIIKIDYKKNVMANMKWTNKWINDINEPNQEFLFVLKK